MDDDNKSKFYDFKKLIEEGSLKLPNNPPLFNALISKEFHRSPVKWPDGNFIVTDPALVPPKPLFAKIHYGQMYISDTPNIDVDEGLYQRHWESPETITTTASNEPAQPALTLDVLKEAMEKLPKDPLLAKGVAKDWVCVINPALVSHIEDFYKTNPPNHFVPFSKLDYVMGRRVHIINEAPLNIEYMPEKVMRLKYADHFLRKLELLKRMQEEEDKPE